MRFDPLAALRVLNEHGVRYLIVGGVAAGLRGAGSTTFDLDICYQRTSENHQKLAAALRALGATLRGAPPALPFQLDAHTIGMGDSFTFDTTAGALDCLGTPAGTNGYDDLMKQATQFDFGEVLAFVASVDDILRMKRAAGRDKDRGTIEILEELKRRDRKS